MNKDSKIYVAGHRGLVGSAIVDALRLRGYTNLVYRTHDELDLTNQLSVRNYFNEERPEYVILAAAKVGGIVANNTYRADFIYENLAIQNNVIHCAYLYKVKKLLFLGSTCIYPKEAPQPMNEDSLLTSPLEYTNEPYAIAKIAGIKMCESYNLQYGTNFISVMPTNLYGPNDNFDLEKSHVLPALLRKVHLAKLLSENRNEELMQDTGLKSFDEVRSFLESYGVSDSKVEIWGSGLPRREFLWSEDMADACVYVMEHTDFADLVEISENTNNTCSEKSIKTQEIRNTHLNIGTGVDISIKELAYLIKDIVGYRGKFYFNSEKPDGTMIKLTNPSKIESLGWRHRVNLKEGIMRMYEWYLKQYE